jgi:glycosyltransferase involved in cell wall biosynthesis
LVDRLVVQRLLNDARGVFVLNGHEAADISSLAPEAYVSVLPNVVRDLPVPIRMQREKSEIRVLFCARLHPRKGVDIFLRVCRGLLDRGLSLKADIVGGDEGAEVDARRLAAELAVPALFHGSLGPAAVRKMMLSADVLLHPAKNEPFGMSMLEAFSARLPVVAARSSELAPVFMNYGAALLPEDEDIDEWVGAVESLVEDEELAELQTSAAIRLVGDRFSIDAIRPLLSEMVSRVRL